jgi:hypothetical protein
MAGQGDTRRLCTITKHLCLDRIDPGYKASSGCLDMGKGDLYEVSRIFSLGKDHFGNPAPDASSDIKAGDIPYFFDAQPVDFHFRLFQADLSCTDPCKHITEHSAGRHTSIIKIWVRV